MTPVYGSLFSGGGGMDLGFDRAGWRCAWQSEIDKDAVSVLNRHWPFTPQLGSVTDVRGDRVDPVDAIIGGFPCQDLSLAGKRKGLAGEKSGLFYEFLRIVGEMREATHGRYPAVALFENVDGLLSSNGGRDFAHVLAGLQELGAAVAFRVFDAQFFRVPQRRRRVFILADFAPVGVGEERAAQVLALRESLCRHPAPGDEAGQRLAAALEDGAGVGGVAYTVHGEHSTAMTGNGNAQVAFPASTARALDTTGGYATNQGGTVVLEPHVCSESGPGWWNEGFGCLRAEGENRPSRPSHVVLEPVAAFGGNRTSGPLDVAACLSSSTQRLDFETQTLIVSSEVASAITASAGHHGHSSPRGDGSDNIVAAYGFYPTGGTHGVSAVEDGHPALKWGTSHGGTSAAVAYTDEDGLRWIVRRLTPVEGERCQGWGDDHTRWRDDGREISDSARWRMIGNGVAAPVAEWLARRMRAALEAS